MGTDADLTEKPPTCPDCGTPRVLTRKWNSGDPKDLWLADCECDERRTEMEIERRFSLTKSVVCSRCGAVGDLPRRAPDGTCPIGCR
jgi:hypothetical protein